MCKWFQLSCLNSAHKMPKIYPKVSNWCQKLKWYVCVSIYFKGPSIYDVQIWVGEGVPRIQILQNKALVGSEGSTHKIKSDQHQILLLFHSFYLRLYLWNIHICSNFANVMRNHWGFARFRELVCHFRGLRGVWGGQLIKQKVSSTWFYHISSLCLYDRLIKKLEICEIILIFSNLV